MQGLVVLRSRKVLAWLGLVACLSLLVFIFNDAPVRLSRLEATAQAVEAHSSTVPQPARRMPSFQDLALPSAYTGKWRQTTLDGAVSLHLLSVPFTLKQTQRQLGGEYYDYAAFLLEEMAAGVKEADLAARLEVLSLRAQTLGHAVREAGTLAYNAAPTEAMTHLQVRSALLAYLGGLTANPLVTVRYNRNGRLLGEANASLAAKPGENLTAFLREVQGLQQHPAMKNYPQMAALIRREADLLEQLSTHLRVRWEETYDAAALLNVRVHAVQTLPELAIQNRF